MRFVLHVTFPPEKFNEAVRDGSAGQRMARILEEIKPEAAYFCAQNGNRGGFLIVNMESASDMPRFAEPWFLYFDAKVEFLPTMTPEDLAKAGLESLGKKWA
jgi:uncharacterized protein DUF3303